MDDCQLPPVLAGKKALVFGIANEEFHSLRLRQGLSLGWGLISPFPG